MDPLLCVKHCARFWKLLREHPPQAHFAYGEAHLLQWSVESGFLIFYFMKPQSQLPFDGLLFVVSRCPLTNDLKFLGGSPGPAPSGAGQMLS